MFINKSQTGANNLIGARLAEMRKATGLSQKSLQIGSSFWDWTSIRTQFSESNAVSGL